MYLLPSLILLKLVNCRLGESDKESARDKGIIIARIQINNKIQTTERTVLKQKMKSQNVVIITIVVYCQYRSKPFCDRPVRPLGVHMYTRI